VQVRVTLAFGEKEAQAEEVGTDTTRNRVGVATGSEPEEQAT